MRSIGQKRFTKFGLPITIHHPLHKFPSPTPQSQVKVLGQRPSPSPSPAWMLDFTMKWMESLARMFAISLNNYLY